jgi:thiol-disulfide isomerase/thioredoxin
MKSHQPLRCSHQPSAISHQLKRRARLAAAAFVVVALAPILSVPGSLFPAPGLYAQETGLPVGAKAPASTIVETLDGKSFDIGQYVGKTPMLIEFWATWCPLCKQLEPTMMDVAKRYGNKVKFIGVAVSVNQTPERVKLYAEKHGLPMEVYFDRKGTAADGYDAAATSYVVIVDKTGTVVYTGLGGSQNLEPALKKALGSPGTPGA